MRNRYLDILRAVAIVRVVVYHVTGWSLLTIAFPAMSVMFALGGSLMAASVDRFGAAAVHRRLRRLLPSLWLLSAIFVPAMLMTGLAWDWRLVFWALPVQDPPANAWGAQALCANWYLREFLWFVLLSPVALPLFRRLPLVTLAAPYLLLIALEIRGWQVPVPVRDAALYFGPWLLGFAHHDGMLRRLSRRLLVTLAGTLAIAGAAWIVANPGPRGYDLNDNKIGNALWAGAFILVMLGFAPKVADGRDRRRWWHRPVAVLNHRALTIYLWHVPILVGVDAVAARAGWRPAGAPGTAARLLIIGLLVAGAVLLFGWVEDVAARRRPGLVPGRRARPAAVVPSAVPAGGAPALEPPRLALPGLVALSAGGGGGRPAAGQGARCGEHIDGVRPIGAGRPGTRPQVRPRRPLVDAMAGRVWRSHRHQPGR